VSFLFEPRLEGAHVHVKVRSASRDPSVQVDHSRGLAGELVFSPDEWHMLRLGLLSVDTPGPTWLRDEVHQRLSIVAGAGCDELEGIEHPGQRFIEVGELEQPRSFFDR
jgi:hypothetical protein